MRNSKKIISLMLLLTLNSCGDDFYGGNRRKPETQAEETSGIFPTRFSTRLTSTLLIAGEKCRGTETTGTFGNGDICNAGQYLVSIDNVNICNGSTCTTDQVTPIVADLIDTNSGIPGFENFEINPKSVTTSTQENILDTVLVRSDSLGNGSVFFR